MKFLATILILFNAFVLKAQISTNELPVSFHHNIEISEQTFEINLPAVNNDSLRILDSISQQDGAYNFAIPIRVSKNLLNDETCVLIEDSIRICRIKLISDLSHASFIIFDDFYLAKGSKLFAYNEDKSQTLGAFTYRNNKPYGRFSIGPVIDDHIILEYVEPKNFTGKSRIHVSSFIHSFNEAFNHVVDVVGNPTFGASQPCNLNVNCPQGNGWCNQRRSVALIVGLHDNDHLIALCSGSLITNERRDSKPYFLTANHCLNQVIGDYTYTPSDFIFIFNYQSDGCNNPQEAPAVTFTISGATLRANHCNSDFALLELSTRPPGNFNTYYNGWDNSSNIPQSGATISHPRGDIKKIMTYNQEGVGVNATCSGLPCSVKSWEINRKEGTIEKGSSGAPLYNENNLIVGQVACGTQALVCEENQSFFFGRFDKSWDDQSGATNQLRPWLNPNATSSISIAAMSGDEPCKSSYFFENANDLHTSANVNGVNPSTGPFPGTRMYDGVYTVSGLIETGVNVTIQDNTSVEFYGRKIKLTSGFHAESGSYFLASPQPCLKGCNTGVGKMYSSHTENVNDVVFISKDETLSKGDKFKIEEKSDLLYDFEKVVIYPNPTPGHFTLEITSSSNQLQDAYKITIYDMMGKSVHSEITNTTQTHFDLSSQSKGIYFVSIQTTEEHIVRRVVVNY